MIRILGTIFAALLGLAFGSFLNVCLSRWPEGESIVKPRSHCRHCGRTLTWWENVPLLSWLALRGRCRTCKVWIGWRYPLVELAVAILWAISAWQSMRGSEDLSGFFAPELAASNVSNFLFFLGGRMILCWLLVALAFLDSEHLWLPNKLTLPGVVLGFLGTILHAALMNAFTSTAISSTRDDLMRPNLFFSALESLLGILAAGGIILLIRWVYWLIRRQEGIGMGDAKLMAMLAAWLGLPGALLAFALGIILGAIAAMVLLLSPRVSRTAGAWAVTKLPLGTFLCIGGAVSALWGQQIIAAYLRFEGLN